MKESAYWTSDLKSEIVNCDTSLSLLNIFKNNKNLILIRKKDDFVFASILKIDDKNMPYKSEYFGCILSDKFSSESYYSNNICDLKLRIDVRALELGYSILLPGI